MSSGKAYCAGTPLFLKTRLSNGYRLSFCHENPNIVKGLVRSIIPLATESDDNQRHITMMFLPVSDIKLFGRLMDVLEKLNPPLTEYSLSPPQLEDVFLNVANSCHGSFLRSSNENIAMMQTSKNSLDIQLHSLKKINDGKFIFDRTLYLY